MKRVIQLILSLFLMASLGGCIFIERPYHDHPRPPPYYGPPRGY